MQRRLRKTLAVALLIGNAALWTPAFSQQAIGLDLFALGSLAESDPAAALDMSSELLEQVMSQQEPDPRLVYDLVRMRADLLAQQGRSAEAAPLLVSLARLATQSRDVLYVDPIPLLREALEIFRAEGDTRAVFELLQMILEEQRAGGAEGETIARTLQELSKTAAELGRAEDAERFAAAADAATAEPESGTRGTDDGFHEVEVYYATDRARTGKSSPSEFYGGERGQLELGVATVTIPDTHTPGVVEAPSVWRLEFSTNPARHVVLRSVEPIEPVAFFRRLQMEMSARPAKELFVFVHGFNVGFEKGAKRAAQIAYDMNYAGVPVLYSWPSQGSAVSYITDTASVRLSGRRLSRFLDDLVARSGATTIHLVAHSMGNRALTDALELFALRNNVSPGSDPVFDQIIFAAPDVDAGLFREMVKTIHPLARRLTLYASENDWALVTSRKLHGNAPRAGQGGDVMLTTPNFDSVDMSELGEDMLAHGYFANDSSALADMMSLFWRNAAPENRCGLVAETEGPGATPKWHYEPGLCTSRKLIAVLSSLQRANADTVAAARKVLKATAKDPEIAKELEPVIVKLVSD